MDSTFESRILSGAVVRQEKGTGDHLESEQEEHDSPGVVDVTVPMMGVTLERRTPAKPVRSILPGTNS